MKLLGRFRDEDGTEKFVFSDENGIIEVTWIKNKEGIAVFCLPTHYYCNLGCKFCHLTESNNGKKEMKPISSESLIECVNFISERYINHDKVLFSFMGVGEPFLNIDLVFDIYKYFKSESNKKVSLALASMMLTLSPFEEIIKEGLPLKIHFSLHSPIDAKRKEVIPSARTSISECLGLLEKYDSIVKNYPYIIENFSNFHQRPSPTEIHYTIIEGVNDSEKDLSEMIKIGDCYKIPLKLIKFNPTKNLKRSSKEKFWLKELSEKYNAPVSFYIPPGLNIGSSCGQFTKHYYLGSNTKEELEEFKRWKKKYQVSS